MGLYILWVKVVKNHTMRLTAIISFAFLTIASSLSASIALATAIEDAYALAAQPDTVFNNEQLLVKRERNNGSVSRKTWIKFDLSSFSLSASTGATLNLKISDPVYDPSSPSSHSVNVYALNANFTASAGELGSDWTDELLTFNNAPGNDSSYHSTDSSDTSFLGSFTTQSSGPTSNVGTIYSFEFNNLSTYVNPSDSTITLILTTSSFGDSNLKFASSENIQLAEALNNDGDPNNDIPAVTGPELQFSVVPEPTHATLLLGLAAGWLVSRRKLGGVGPRL